MIAALALEFLHSHLQLISSCLALDVSACLITIPPFSPSVKLFQLFLHKPFIKNRIPRVLFPVFTNTVRSRPPRFLQRRQPRTSSAAYSRRQCTHSHLICDQQSITKEPTTVHFPTLDPMRNSPMALLTLEQPGSIGLKQHHWLLKWEGGSERSLKMVWRHSGKVLGSYSLSEVLLIMGGLEKAKSIFSILTAESSI